MVGAGKVVPHGLRVPPAQEDGAGVFDLAQIVKGAVHAQLQVLRSNAVGHVDGLLQVGSHDDFAVIIDGGPGNLLPLQQGDLALQLLGHRLGQLAALSDQHGGGHLVVLRLAQEVRSHKSGAGLTVGNDQHLRGSGNHVDVHLSKDLLFGLSHIGVAGTNDLVHLGDRLCPVGQSGDGLGSAHLVDLGNASNLGSGQNGGVHLAVLSRRGDHDDLPYPGNMGGDGVHQHGGGVGCGASGDIDAHPCQGHDLLPQDDPLFFLHDETLPLLLGVVGPDVLRRLLQHGQKLRLLGGQGLVQLLLRHSQCRQLHLIKLPGVVVEGGVSLGLHPANDLRHRLRHILYRVVAQEDVLVPHFIHIINLDHKPPHRSRSSASRSRMISSCLNL